MEIKKINEDIRTLCVKAISFPDGVETAHNAIHAFPHEEIRRFFGISWMGKNNEIVYYAAADELSSDEAKKFGCETFTIKKGDYCGIMLKDWCNTPDLVGITFQELLKHPDLDPEGYCLEIYHGERDMECLVKLKH